MLVIEGVVRPLASEPNTAQWEMIAKHEWLAHRLKRQLKQRAALQSLDFSDRVHDVVSDAMIEAVLTFDGEQGPFPAWATRISGFRWQDAQKKEYRHRAQLNMCRLLGWLRGSTSIEEDDEGERAATVDPAARAATAYLLGLLSEHSYQTGLDQEELMQWHPLAHRVEGLLAELGKALGPTYEQVMRLTDMQPGRVVWATVGLELGLDKRTARKRHSDALAWLSERLS